MKIRDGFIVRDVAGKSFAVATGELSKQFKGMITLNETGKFIWNMLQKDVEIEDIVDAILKEYQITDRALVEADVTNFVNKLSGDNVLE